MGPQTSNRFGLFELVVCFTSLSHDSSHKDGGLKKMEKKKKQTLWLCTKLELHKRKNSVERDVDPVLLLQRVRDFGIV